MRAATLRRMIGFDQQREGDHAMRNRTATLLQIVVFMLALSSVPAAHALEIYAGAEGTATTLTGGCNNAAGSSCDDNGTGWKAFAGLQLIRLTAIEVGYIDFGKAQTSGSTSAELSG